LSDTYAVTEVAVMIGVSPSTVRNYSNQLEIHPYLSDFAARRGPYKDAKERRYTLDDVMVLNTVKVHKAETWTDIVAVLDTGKRDELPESASLVLAETRADMFQVLARARERIVAQEEQLEELEQKLAQEQTARREDIERLVKEREDMREEIGGYKLLLKLNGIDPKTGKKLE
jgi:DNA-binding transcriptional MerR regulator